MPQVSVIVPVYNVEPYLKMCLNSILSQSYTEFELILVDDGSTDNSGAICDAYAKQDGRVQVIHQDNGGLSAARNAGIDWVFTNSDSEWIAFIDSDDYVCKDYLQTLYHAAIENHAEVSIVRYGRFIDMIPSEDEKEPIQCILTGKEACELIYDELKRDENPETAGCSFVSAWSKLFRRTLLKNVSFPIGKLHEDQGTTYKLLYQAKTVAVINKKLYYYRQNPSSLTNQKFTVRRYDDLAFLKEASEFYESYGDAYLAQCALKRINFLKAIYSLKARHAGIYHALPDEYQTGSVLKTVCGYVKEFGLSSTTVMLVECFPSMLKAYMLVKKH